MPDPTPTPTPTDLGGYNTTLTTVYDAEQELYTAELPGLTLESFDASCTLKFNYISNFDIGLTMYIYISSIQVAVFNASPVYIGNTFAFIYNGFEYSGMFNNGDVNLILSPTPTPTKTPAPTPTINAVTGTAKPVPASEPEFLDNLLTCNDYYIKLFKNDLDENNLSFTECTFIGYASKLLDKNKWSPSVFESGYVVSYYSDPLVWGCSDPVESTIYGYYIVNESETVIWYYKFPEPVEISSLQAISLTLRIVLGCP